MKNLRFSLTIILCWILYQPCFSQFYVKNGLPDDIYVATANYYVTKPGTGSIEGWGTQGWFLIRPNEKVEVIKSIDNRYVYVYAYNTIGGDLLKGDTPFLVENFDSFRNFGPLWRCYGDWIYRKQSKYGVSAAPLFQKIDVKTATDFTFTIQFSTK